MIMQYHEQSVVQHPLLKWVLYIEVAKARPPRSALATPSFACNEVARLECLWAKKTAPNEENVTAALIYP